MADEELHKTTPTAPSDSENSKDSRNSKARKDSTAQKAWDQTGDAEAVTKDDKNADDETYGVSLDKVEAVLNSTVDKDSMTPQIRRMIQRQAEDTKRVEETIKGTKANPGWFVPLFCILMIIGLAWAITFYLTNKYPIPALGNWNLAVAFAFMIIGFLMTMGWR